MVGAEKNGVPSMGGVLGINDGSIMMISGDTIIQDGSGIYGGLS